MPRARPAQRWEADLRRFALGFPEAREEFPWGHSAFKVKGKVFLFLSSGEEGQAELSLSVKLPTSRAVALMLPFTEPTGYGLGRSGWVSARFPHGGGEPPLPLLREWITESYRAIAPKRLLAATAAAAPPAAQRKRPAAKRRR